MNLVVIAGKGEVGERAAGIVDGLTGRHPSRTLIVSSADPDGPAWLDAQVQAHCLLPTDGAAETCAELVYLTAGGETAQHLAGVVAPLLIHDLPVTVWWPSEPRFESVHTELLRWPTGPGRRSRLGGRRAPAPGGDGPAPAAVPGRDRRLRAHAPGALARGDRLDVRPARAPAVSRASRPDHGPLRDWDVRRASRTSSGRCTTWPGSRSRLGMTGRGAPVLAATEPWVGYEADAPATAGGASRSSSGRSSRRHLRGTTLVVEAARDAQPLAALDRGHRVRRRCHVVHASLDADPLPERRFWRLGDARPSSPRRSSGRPVTDLTAGSRWAISAAPRGGRGEAAPASRMRSSNDPDATSGAAAETLALALREAVEERGARPTGRPRAARRRSGSTTRFGSSRCAASCRGHPCTPGGVTSASSHATTRFRTSGRSIGSCWARCRCGRRTSTPCRWTMRSPRAATSASSRRSTTASCGQRACPSPIPGFPILDVVLVGLGGDGHVLSVFPGSPLFDSADWVSGVPAPKHIEPHVARVSLNPGCSRPRAADGRCARRRQSGDSRLRARVRANEQRWPAQVARLRRRDLVPRPRCGGRPCPGEAAGGSQPGRHADRGLRDRRARAADTRPRGASPAPARPRRDRRPHDVAGGRPPLRGVSARVRDGSSRPWRLGRRPGVRDRAGIRRPCRGRGCAGRIRSDAKCRCRRALLRWSVRTRGEPAHPGDPARLVVYEGAPVPRGMSYRPAGLVGAVRGACPGRATRAPSRSRSPRHCRHVRRGGSMPTGAEPVWPARVEAAHVRARGAHDPA